MGVHAQKEVPIFFAMSLSGEQRKQMSWFSRRPPFFLTMGGQMKVLIDRLLPEWQGLGGKEAYVL